MKALHFRYFFTVIITIISMCANANSQNFIKAPNVSGQFYPSDKAQLVSQIDEFFLQAKSDLINEKIKIIISPHAGYIYSGLVAAYGYKAAKKQKYSTIVVLAPTHHFKFSGVSVWAKGAFETPLGLVAVDEDFTNKLIEKNKNVNFIPEVFVKEHSLEVQIPFLQRTFKDFRIVPVIVGQIDYDQCESFASSLDEIIGDREDVLIVVSTDMSHYHNAKIAKNMDDKTISFIKDLDARELLERCSKGLSELCGVFSVSAALLYAQKRNLDVSILKYADSGDVTGDKSAVVGYLSAVFYKQDKLSEDNDKTILLSDVQKKRLIEIATKTIKEYVENENILDVSEDDERFLKEEGAFVTIHKDGNLRGCIGNILGRGPLYKTVRDMAIASCSQDPRFPPVSKKELEDLEIEVSVLSKPWKISDSEEIELGVHGVIVTKDSAHRGLFLPQVATEQGWNREQFLSYLCAHKAGLPADAWKDPSITLEIFSAQVFSEKDF
ncbi:MAG: AmmeMemoRadiSam system protein B [Candidatus Aceula lacicola]|nr:AmmeMemoRadiSam system protein B [Candidatus Aceula lacicola]